MTLVAWFAFVGLASRHSAGFAFVERITKMTNDLDTEIAKKWEEAIELAYAIEGSLSLQAEVIQDYKIEPAALKTVFYLLATHKGGITFDDAIKKTTDIGNLESLDFSYLKEVTDYTCDLLQLLRELEELEEERKVTL